jgi:hypothetical protein
MFSLASSDPCQFGKALIDYKIHRMSSRSLERPNPRSTPSKSFTNVMKRGRSLRWVKRLLRPTRTTSPCEYTYLLPPLISPIATSSRNADTHRSHNTTVKGSKGLITTQDQAYTSIPADSRKPAAAIDPSSESSSLIDHLITCGKYRSQLMLCSL